MNLKLRETLFTLAEENQAKGDPSHDFEHIRRVVGLAEKIGQSINADLDVIIPAALFHDVVVYPKNDPRSKNEAKESAQFAKEILVKLKDYPQEKIELVCASIEQCSFSKGIIPDLIESKVLQDADRLEATGAISIMRTFSSGGQMNRPLYAPFDPFREKTEADNFSFGLDLFYKRLLVVESKMYTDFAKNIAKRRTIFLKDFLEELKLELKESAVFERELK